MSSTDIAAPTTDHVDPTRPPPATAPEPARPRPAPRLPVRPVAFPESITSPRRRRRRVVVPLLVVAAVVAAAGAGVVVARSRSSTPSYRTTTVSRHAVEQSLTAVATIEPTSQATLAFPTSGTVATVDVAVGDHVAAGQTVATLDRASLQDTLAQKQTALTKAQLALTEAATASTTTTTAPSSGSGSSGTTGANPSGAATSSATSGSSTAASSAPTGSASASASSTAAGSTSSGSTSSGSATSVADAQRGVADAEAEVAAAEQALDQATLASPLVGVVQAVTVTPGASVSATSTTATIVVAGTDQLEATTLVPIDDIADVRVGQAASVVPDGRTEPIAAKVASIAVSPTTRGSTTAYRVFLRFDQPVTDLGNGSTATATIVTASVADALAVPTSAVTTDGTSHSVSVIEGGSVRATRVQVGATGGEWTEITSGLSEDQTVALADLGQVLPSSATDAANASRTGVGGSNGFPGAPPGDNGGPPPGFSGQGPPSAGGIGGR